MEAEKRKRADDGVDGKRTRVREDNGRVAVAVAEDDDEVEEFFAILQRIQVAVKYFKKVNGEEDGRRELMAKGSKRWSPSFERGDFDEKVDGVKGPEGVEGEDAGLDLNADPEAEEMSTP